MKRKNSGRRNGCDNTCKFCSTTKETYDLNDIETMDAALQTAIEQSHPRHILISGGSPKKEDHQKMLEIYRHFGNKYKNFDIDIMCTPWDDPNFHSDMKSNGIHGLAINMELWNDEILKQHAPEKHTIGKKKYLNFIENGVKVFGPDRVRSCVIVGLEPMRDTLTAVNALAQIGCNPVLSPYVPYNNFGKKSTADFLKETKLRALEICNRNNVKLGPLCAPCRHNTL